MAKTVVFVYGKGRVATGQQRASELAAEGLRVRGWRVREIKTPLLDRTAPATARHLACLAAHLASAWLRGLALAFGRCSICVNLGQTRFGLIRDGWPLLVRRAWAGGGRAVVSLHGSPLAEWTPDSLRARLLRRIASAARWVTVLGQRQKQHLIALGVPAEKVLWLDNTCELAPLDDSECLRKHVHAAPGSLKVLHLSNLMEAKGYAEFVGAICQLAERPDISVEATLCGPVVRLDDDAAFSSVEEARSWIWSQVKQVNASRSVRLRWIEGAYGADKEALFRQAHVFVLPTRYRVEAQPLTILEALASGCAVVTTRAGEIPTTVSEETAVFLDDTEPESIAQAIVDLARDPERRTRLALNGLALFRERFSYERHIDRWEQLLTEAADGDC